jgi:hypothetical protein
MPIPSPDTVALEYTPPIETIPELESWEEVGEEYTTHNPVINTDETSQPITEEQFYSIYEYPRRTRTNNKKQKKTKSGRKTKKSKKNNKNNKKSKKRRYYK